MHTTHAHIRTHTHINTHMCTHTQLNTHMHIYIYIYIYICKCTRSLSLAHPLFLFVYLSHKNINTHNNHTHTLTRTRTNTLTFNLHSFQRYFHTRHTTPTLTLIHTIMHTSDSNTVLPYFVFCLLQMCVCHFSTVNLCAVYTVHGVICARHTPSMLHIETFLRRSDPLPRWSMPFSLPGQKIVLQPPFAKTAAKAPACKNMHIT